MADDDGLLHTQLSALPSDGVRESRHRVFLFGRIAHTVTAKIDGYDATALGEMANLRREDSLVAGPAVDQNERGSLRIGRPSLEVREAHTIAFHENRL